MPDRKKVIKGLEYCITHYNWRDNRKPDCPYLDLCEPIKDATGNTLMRDALALLKEQEAVEPSFKQDEKGIFIWYCGSCGAYMYHIYDGIDKAKEYAKYCRQCGKKVKWE